MTDERAVVLEVEDLVVRYGPVQAVRGISLTLHEDECLGVVGANGAGKSSLLAGIIGLVRPVAGRVTLCGTDITGSRPEDNVRRGLVLVPERRQLFASMSVYDNLVLGSYVRGRDATIAEDIERVEALFPILAERRSQRAGTLSGGEQQMLAIGRGLMSLPRVLMVDEPSLGLAPVVVDAVAAALGELHRQGMTILVVEQNIRLAMELAERLLVVEQGAVVREDDSGGQVGQDEIVAVYLGRPETGPEDRRASDRTEGGAIGNGSRGESQRKQRETT